MSVGPGPALGFFFASSDFARTGLLAGACSATVAPSAIPKRTAKTVGFIGLPHWENRESILFTIDRLRVDRIGTSLDGRLWPMMDSLSGKPTNAPDGCL